jgi:hypothetical protein
MTGNGAIVNVLGEFYYFPIGLGSTGFMGHDGSILIVILSAQTPHGQNWRGFYLGLFFGFDRHSAPDRLHHFGEICQSFRQFQSPLARSGHQSFWVAIIFGCPHMPDSVVGESPDRL